MGVAVARGAQAVDRETGVVGAGRAGAVMKMRPTVAAQTPIAELL